MSDFLERIDDYRSSFQRALDGHQSGMWTALPGIVTKVDLEAMTCEVQPAIQGIEKQTDGTLKHEDMPMLVDVPIVFLHGGKYAHTDPVAVDDECLVVFSSRCIDNWWQEGGVQPQFERRNHDLSDGIAIVGPFSQKTKLSDVSKETSQWRTTDGTMYYELDNDNQKAKVIIKGITVEIDAQNSVININGSNNIKVNANTAIDLTAPTVTVHGNLDVTGNLRWGTGGTPTTAATHRHGTTGTPIAAQTIPPTPGT